MKAPMHKRPRSPYLVLAFIAFGLLSVIVAQPAAQKPTKTVPAKAVQRSKKAVELLDLAMAKSDERIPKALLTRL